MQFALEMGIINTMFDNYFPYLFGKIYLKTLM